MSEREREIVKKKDKEKGGEIFELKRRLSD